VRKPHQLRNASERPSVRREENMIVLRDASEAEMVLEFLKAEKSDHPLVSTQTLMM
jgi:hypothetical protein